MIRILEEEESLFSEAQPRAIRNGHHHNSNKVYTRKDDIYGSNDDITFVQNARNYGICLSEHHAGDNKMCVSMR